MVTVALKDGRRLTQMLAAGSGFLSQSSKWLHFGLGSAGAVSRVSVRWPGLEREETFGALDRGRWTLKQGTGTALADTRPRAEMGVRPLVLPPAPAEAEVVLTAPRESTAPLIYQSWEGAPVALETDSLTVTLLWASWCQPCLRELEGLGRQKEALDRAGIRLVALNVEEAQAALEGGTPPNAGDLREILDKVRWPFPSGRAPLGLVQSMDQLQRTTLYRQEALPLPSSFAWHRGQLLRFYKGAVSVEALLRAKAALAAPSPQGRPSHAVPLGGRWSTAHFVTNPVAIARVYLEDRYFEAAREYLTDALADLETVEDAGLRRRQEADLRFTLGESHRLEGAAPSLVLPHYERALELNPDHASAALSYAWALSAIDRAEEAIPVLRRMITRYPQRRDLAIQLGNTYQAVGRDRESAQTYEGVLRAAPDDFQALNQLCWVYATSPEPSVRDPAKAMALGRQVLQRFGTDNVHALDTVSAALASAGEYAKAVELMGRAVSLVKSRGETALLGEIQGRLELYQRERPFLRPKP